MKKPAKLDVRRSRKLTSRECASILGGYVGGMATSELIGVDRARATVGMFVDPYAGEAVWYALRLQAEKGSQETCDAIDAAGAEFQASSGSEAMRICWRGLGAVVGGLRVVASERAVKTALRWIYEQDGFWPEKKGEEVEGVTPTAPDELVSTTTEESLGEEAKA
jgi:hypothetical protein